MVSFFQFEVRSFAVSLKFAMKYTALSLISHRVKEFWMKTKVLFYTKSFLIIFP